MNVRILCATVFSFVSFGMGGCATMRGDAQQTTVTPTPAPDPAPASVPPCDRTERDLTRPWALRRYWCNGQQAQAASPQTLKSATTSLSAPEFGTQAVRNAASYAMFHPAPEPQTNPASHQPPHNIWFARGNPDLGPDGLRRTAKLAKQLKQTLREGQTVWLRGSTLVGEVADDKSLINQLAFDRAWAVRMALRARGVEAPIRIRRPIGAQYGRKVIVSVL